jgi:two-component system sensor histidine kinase KdpD
MSTTTATDRTWRRTATGLTVAAAGLTATTLALTPARHHLSLAGIVLLYLIPVLTTAATGGWPPAIAAAVTADLLVNYLFIPPFHTLAVETTDNLITLAVYVTVATAAGLTVDLAARHRATAAARTRQAQRLAGQAAELAHIDRTRAALLGAVGHDLRTPLAGIKAAASSLRQPDITFTTHDRAELLATIEESTDRLTALVDNLLSLSRLQAGALSVQLTPTALDAVVAQAVLNTDTHDTTIDIDVPDDLPLALADPGLLERVVANLLSNACAATPTGRPVHIHGHAHHDRLHLRIIDHGPGIAPADRDRVFAPFQRLNDHDPTGLGLGLAIARGFTEAQHATLTPDDTPDGGLTMTITLPAAPTRTTPR